MYVDFKTSRFMNIMSTDGMPLANDPYTYVTKTHTMGGGVFGVGGCTGTYFVCKFWAFFVFFLNQFLPIFAIC